LIGQNIMKHLLTFVFVLCLVFFVTSQTTESIEDLENQVHSLELEYTETLGRIEDEATQAVEEATRSTNALEKETQATQPVNQNNTVKKETTSSQCDPAKAKSKTTTLLLAIFLGGIGVDRFYIGDVTTVIFLKRNFFHRASLFLLQTCYLVEPLFFHGSSLMSF
jgi:hypothetical protein